jgi:TetR/AcrR family transcriptional regulator, cholesterol catabolism regulator
MSAKNELSDTPASDAVRVGARARGRPRKTADQRDDGNRRQVLIAAAAKLFRKKSFAATSTRDIADAVGMQSGSMFYHFKSKEELLGAVMEEGMLRATQMQTQALIDLLSNIEHKSESLRWATAKKSLKKAEKQAVAQLQALIRNHFDVLLGQGNDFIGVMLYESRSLNAQQRARVAQLQTQYEAAWLPVLDALHAQGLIRGDAQLAKLFVFGALNWSAQWYARRGRANLDDLTQAALDLFLK